MKSVPDKYAQLRTTPEYAEIVALSREMVFPNTSCDNKWSNTAKDIGRRIEESGGLEKLIAMAEAIHYSEEFLPIFVGFMWRAWRLG